MMEEQLTLNAKQLLLQVNMSTNEVDMVQSIDKREEKQKYKHKRIKVPNISLMK